MSDPRRLAARATSMALLVLIPMIAPASAARDAASLLAAADAARAPYRAGRVTIRVTSDREGRRVPDGEIDVLLGGDAATLAIFRTGKQAGRRILTLGDRTWLLVPGTRNPIPMNSQQRLAGAASIADLARLDLARDYTATLREKPEAIEGQPRRVLDLRAKSHLAAYPTGVLWLDAVGDLPRRLVLRLPSFKDARRLDFVGFRSLGGRPAVERIEIRDLLAKRPGVTTIEFRDHDPAPVEPSWLTIEGARSAP